jgi:UDP-glucose 4-epimerase
MRMPMRYLLDNAANGIRLIDACVRHGVGQFVLSSTAALFNLDSDAPIPEDAPIDPQSAYGDSKWMIERALRWAGEVHGLRYACLRYFNAAGADPAGRLGEDHRPESHLIPLVIDAALGRRAALDVFGDNYPTADGTCIRDYVHVSDLASAHLLAVEAMDRGSSVVWNLGNGAGHSVRQVIASVERVSRLKVPYQVVGRRAGDAAVLVASSDRAQQAGWRPAHGDLDDIVRTAFEWRKSHPDGYGD